MQQILFRSQFIEIKTNEQTKCIKCLTIKTPFRKVIIITVIKELKIRGDRTAIPFTGTMFVPNRTFGIEILLFYF